MDELLPERIDPTTNEVVLIPGGRRKDKVQLQRKAPPDWSKTTSPEIISGEKCPFCVGHENETPAEVIAYRYEGTNGNEPGWWVRSLPNKFSALEPPSSYHETLATGHYGPFIMKKAYGFTYVIVETTDHCGSLATASLGQVRELLNMTQDLMKYVNHDPNIVYAQFFENVGPTAGASLPHPHSQLYALSAVPKEIETEIQGAKRYYNRHHQRCFYCTEQSVVLNDQLFVIEETNNFFSWCPCVSRVPFMIKSGPKTHQTAFTDVSNSPAGCDPLSELANLIKRTLTRLNKVLLVPDYNMYLHVSPFSQIVNPYYHWHFVIEPITAIPAGFEKSTGELINPYPPEKAAEDLRAAAIDE